MNSEQMEDHLYRLIVRGGRKGRTERELSNSSRHFRGATSEARERAIASLVESGRISLVKSRAPHNRGRDRVALVSINADITADTR